MNSWLIQRVELDCLLCSADHRLFNQSSRLTSILSRTITTSSMSSSQIGPDKKLLALSSRVCLSEIVQVKKVKEELLSRALPLSKIISSFKERRNKSLKQTSLVNTLEARVGEYKPDSSMKMRLNQENLKQHSVPGTCKDTAITVKKLRPKMRIRYKDSV